MGKNISLGDPELLGGFREWVERKYGLTESHGSWDRIILFFSQDESDALNRFFELYNEYRETE